MRPLVDFVVKILVLSEEVKGNLIFNPVNIVKSLVGYQFLPISVWKDIC